MHTTTPHQQQQQNTSLAIRTSIPAQTRPQRQVKAMPPLGMATTIANTKLPAITANCCCTSALFSGFLFPSYGFCCCLRVLQLSARSSLPHSKAPSQSSNHALHLRAQEWQYACCINHKTLTVNAHSLNGCRTKRYAMQSLALPRNNDNVVRHSSGFARLKGFAAVSLIVDFKNVVSVAVHPPCIAAS